MTAKYTGLPKIVRLRGQIISQGSIKCNLFATLVVKSEPWGKEVHETRQLFPTLKVAPTIRILQHKKKSLSGALLQLEQLDAYLKYSLY